MNDLTPWRRIVWGFPLPNGFRLELNRVATDGEVTQAILDAASAAVEDRVEAIVGRPRDVENEG